MAWAGGVREDGPVTVRAAPCGVSPDALLTDPGFASDPYPAYEILRREAPVHWSEAWGCWVVSRYDDVLEILQQPNLFSNEDRVGSLLGALPEGERARFAALEQHFGSGMVHTDPPDHTRLRKLAAHAFTPRVVATLEPRIRAIVDEHLDGAAAAGRFELIGDLAYPLPATVIADLLGVPHEDRDQFKEWGVTSGAFQATGTPEIAVVEAAQEAVLAKREYLRAQLRLRREHPTDDLLTLFGQAEADGQMLHEDEVLSIGATMLSAGHETTTSLIGNGILAFLRHPEELQRFRDDPELTRSAVEEIIRYDGPLQRGWRRVAEDVEFRGHRFAADQLVVVLLGAANRDPDRFPDPDRFDIGRSDNRHLGWGHGAHFCLGAALARMEGAIALRAIVDRYPDLGPAPETVTWRARGVFRCLDELVVAG